MKRGLLLLLFISATFCSAQICPVIERRNNGNGLSNRCAGVNGTPVASNFTGTSFATAITGLAKTGDIKFIFTGYPVSPPAIKRIWIGNTLSTVVAGPASVPVVSSGNSYVEYCFYNQNLPTAGTYTLEFVDPQTNATISFCGFSGSSNIAISAPLITTQPESQYACIGGNVKLSVVAQPSNGGNLNYQWRKNGTAISGATTSTWTISNVSYADSAYYDCLIGESTGTFITSNKAKISVSSCQNTVYFDSCIPSSMASTATDAWNAAWVDYDNDGNEDLYINSKDNVGKNLLYKNNGNGTFSRVDGSTISNIVTTSVASAWADYDNDGLVDVFMVNDNKTSSSIYKNNGNGIFTEIKNSGISNSPKYFHGAAWLDYDMDGYVDLLVTNFFETQFHHLYRNNQNGTFSKVEQTPITLESERSMAPIIADYNNDGLPDVFIPNGNNRPNSLFKNKGAGAFEKVTSGAIATDAYNSVGAAWGDFNNDGFTDLFVANASGQNNNLYKNNGDGTFTSLTNSIVCNNGGHSHGANWVDINNDGYLDLLVTNDVGPKFLYINNGDETFSRITDEPIATDFGLSFGQAWADYNKDGYRDVAIVTHSNRPDFLFCGKSSGSNKWISLRLKGTASNACAIGTAVRVKTNGKWQLRQVFPVSGFGSQNSLIQHFGLGNTALADSIEIKWTSGYKQILTNVQPNQLLTITEQTANSVSGVTFNDVNNNCIKDDGEQNVSAVTLRLSQDNTQFSSNYQGQYSLRLETGSYTASLPENPNWELNCQINFNVTTGSNTTINIPLSAKRTGYDLDIVLGTTVLRRGFRAMSTLIVKNIGPYTAINSKVTVRFPSEIKVIKSTSHSAASFSLSAASIAKFKKLSNTKENPLPSPSRISGSINNFTNSNTLAETTDTYTFELGTLEPGAVKIITIDDSVTLAATTGQTLAISADASADDTDLFYPNNSYSLQQPIVGPLDPNDIRVSPEGEGAEGFIPKEQELLYTIRFQNVGTYQADKVYIENDLSPYFDLSSFKVESASHNFTYQISNKGQLQITFNNINLPDSTSDQVKSNGFFSYKIKPHARLDGGELIENSAAIIFDYEDPVLTNTARNTIKKRPERNSQLLVYPNPVSQGSVSVALISRDPGIAPSVISTIQVFNISGKMEINLKNVNQSTTKFGIENLAPGTYVLRCTDLNSTIYTSKINIQ